MIDPEIKQRLEALDPAYRSFVTSGYSSEAAVQYGNEIGLNDAQITTLENGILLYLLFFFNKAEFVEFVQQEVGVTDQQVAYDVVTSYIASLPDDFAGQLDGKVASGEVASTPSPQAINPIHTMAADMDAVKSGEATYTSSQAAILRESQNRANGIDDTPQWGNVGNQ